MNKASNKEQKIAKSLIVLGDNHVGKSSIITQFTKERFSEDYKSTIGVYFQSKEIKILNQTVYLSIWDVYGEEIKNTILDSRIYANANCFLLVVSYDNLDSSQTILNWIEFIRDKYQVSSLNRNIRDVPIFIVINKEDIRDKQFTRIQIEKITRENCPFVNVCEVNAKNNQTINSLFQGMCARMLGLNIEDIGLDITDESIVQITPIKFKFLCLKCH